MIRNNFKACLQFIWYHWKLSVTDIFFVKLWLTLFGGMEKLNSLHNMEKLCNWSEFFIVNPIAHGVLDNTYTWGGGQIAPAPYNSVISKGMDLKFGMFK